MQVLSRSINTQYGSNALCSVPASPLPEVLYTINCQTLTTMEMAINPLIQTQTPCHTSQFVNLDTTPLYPWGPSPVYAHIFRWACLRKYALGRSSHCHHCQSRDRNRCCSPRPAMHHSMLHCYVRSGTQEYPNAGWDQSAEGGLATT